MAKAKEVTLDKPQVKKAVQALVAFLKSEQKKESLFTDDTEPVDLLFTLWKIPRVAQTIRIPLPHGLRDETHDICLFTRDEPKMDSEQTQRFFRKLLDVNGVKNVSEIIPYKVLKTEYKSFESKRRLLGNHTVFLSDDRVRRLLPSHIGRHFYDRKQEPLCVNLQSKHLARDIERLVQGTRLKVSNRGCCCMAHVGHTGMTTDQLMENIEASIQTIVAKINVDGPVLKIVHLKSKKSVALPIYTADLEDMNILLKTAEHVKKEEEVAAKREAKRAKKEAAKKERQAVSVKGKKKQEKKVEVKEKVEVKVKEEEEDEEIPQLVPIPTPSKKAKLQKKPKVKKEKQQLEIAPKPATAKKNKKAPKKLPKKAGKTDPTTKRKTPKVK